MLSVQAKQIRMVQSTQAETVASAGKKQLFMGWILEKESIKCKPGKIVNCATAQFPKGKNTHTKKHRDDHGPNGRAKMI